MNRCVVAGTRTGCVRIPASKSQAHRLLICAALGEETIQLRLDGRSKDIDATIACLAALGAQIEETEDGLLVTPIQQIPESLCVLECGESGSTLRFLLPVCGVLGANAVFLMQGRLPERPLAPLDDELRAHGMTLRQEGARLYVSGQLRGGEFTLPGNVSSQFVSGLLMALPRLREKSALHVQGTLQSAGYVDMTMDALRLSGLEIRRDGNTFCMEAEQHFALPQKVQVEGDWSSAAFFLCMGAFSRQGIRVEGLLDYSAQADRVVLTLLRRFGAEVVQEAKSITVRRGRLHGMSIDASQFPDLVPVLAMVAAGADGETVIANAARLRLKESDRLQTTAAMLRTLGAEIQELPDGLRIQGKAELLGGTIDACGDHRIAMAAAAAAVLCKAPITIVGAETVEKSYPRFWMHFDALKGETP